MEIMARGAVRTDGFEFAMRTVKFPTGDVAHVHTMLFADLATHQRFGPPGLTMDRPETSARATAKRHEKITAAKGDIMTMLERQGKCSALGAAK